MLQKLEGPHDPRGVIVAGVNDAGEPYVAIVAAGFTGAPHGEDVWRLLDAHGETVDVICSTVPVVDEDRIAELRAALEAHA